jgi:hypothetical protein
MRNPSTSALIPAKIRVNIGRRNINLIFLEKKLFKKHTITKARNAVSITLIRLFLYDKVR